MSASITIRPAITALVVAMAGIMLPAMATWRKGGCEERERGGGECGGRERRGRERKREREREREIIGDNSIKPFIITTC